MRASQGPLLIVDVRKFIAPFSCALSAEKLGTVWRQIEDSAIRGDKVFLKQFSFIKSYRPALVRRTWIPKGVRQRVLNATPYCQRCKSTDGLEIDHIKPLAKGGLNEEENLQVLCGDCNRRKGHKWPEN